VLLRFLTLRLVVNGMHIYPLAKGKPVVVTVPTNPARLVVTDGFHITPPVQIAYAPQRIHYFNIACIVENDVLVGCSIFMTLLFFMGLSSGLIILWLLSISPVLCFLFLYYVKRKEFIRIRPA
jgi:hypothetical protein